MVEYGNVNVFQVKVVQKFAQDILYVSLGVAIFLMSFYIYIKKFIPATPYFKDIVLLIVAFLVLFNFLVTPKRIKVNLLDSAMVLLLLYLIFQFLYTLIVTDSFEFAYYGFRLTFLPVVLYFGFRSVSGRERHHKIYKVFFYILVIGVFITLIESFVVSMGLINKDFMFSILETGENVKDYQLAGAYRPVGIAGSPHISGVYNLVLLSMLLFLYKEDIISSITNSPKTKNMLFILSLLAVIFSTSRTAWTILVFVLLIFILSRRRIMRMTIKKLAICISVIILSITLLMYFGEKIYTVGSFDTYLYFFENYYTMALDALTPTFQQSPLIGFGFEAGTYAPIELRDIRAENLETQSDLFWAQLFKMLGGLGLGLFLCLFIIIPLYLIFVKKYSFRIKSAAMAILVIGLSFIHYSPLIAPSLAVITWYLFAHISEELSTQKSLT